VTARRWLAVAVVAAAAVQASAWHSPAAFAWHWLLWTLSLGANAALPFVVPARMSPLTYVGPAGMLDPVSTASLNGDPARRAAVT
jgi:hypothetical protein